MLLTLWSIWQLVKVYFGLRFYRWIKSKWKTYKGRKNEIRI